jgi:hypothetical protein
MSDKEIIVYMASLLDGEGSMLLDVQSPRENRKYHYFNIRLVVTNTSKDLMEWLIKNFKGVYRSRKKIEGRKQCYSWVIFSKDAIDIIDSCMPYFIIKKSEALILKEFWNTVGKTGWKVTTETREHRKFLYEKLKNIHQNKS